MYKLFLMEDRCLHKCEYKCRNYWRCSWKEKIKKLNLEELEKEWNLTKGKFEKYKNEYFLIKDEEEKLIKKRIEIDEKLIKIEEKLDFFYEKELNYNYWYDKIEFIKENIRIQENK